VYAFESDGRRAWQHDTGSLQAVLPAGLAADGTVYVQEAYGALYALDRADGTRRWWLPATAARQSVGGLIVRDDGTLLFALLGDRQYGAVDGAGTMLWQKSGALAGLALGPGGAAYAADGTGVSRLDRDGFIVWQALAGGARRDRRRRGHRLQRGAGQHRRGRRGRPAEVGVAHGGSGDPELGAGGARPARDRRGRHAVRVDQRPRARAGRRRALRGSAGRL
jgi:outer membrane protein assembly factor BamB